MRAMQRLKSISTVQERGLESCVGLPSAADKGRVTWRHARIEGLLHAARHMRDRGPRKGQLEAATQRQPQGAEQSETV